MNKKYGGNITRSLPHTPLLVPSWNDSPSKGSAPKPLMPTLVPLRTSSTTSLGKIPASCLRQTKQTSMGISHILSAAPPKSRAMERWERTKPARIPRSVTSPDGSFQTIPLLSELWHAVSSTIFSSVSACVLIPSIPLPEEITGGTDYILSEGQ